MRIVFMGTPDFAVVSLKKLIDSRHTVAGVVTVPDKRKGRGRQVGISAVKAEAEKHNLPLLQPDDLTDSGFIQRLKQWQADCFAVVAFRILPEAVFSLPAKGTVNLHASLLPRYRGAAPIQWALMNGDTETGVTTFFIQKKVDAGHILLQASDAIPEGMNAGELHDVLAESGASLLLQTMDGIESGSLEGKDQSKDVTRAPKILPCHCQIEWTRPAEEIRNQIRALAPRPGAFSALQGRRIKVFEASLVQNGAAGTPGEIETSDDNELIVQTGNGKLRLELLQLQGKKRMTADAFLRGHAIQPGDHFHTEE